MEVHSRRLLLHTPLYEPLRSSATPAFSSAGAGRDTPEHGSAFDGIDTGVIIIMSALLCTVVWVLAINAVVRCAIRVVNRSWSRSSEPVVNAGDGGEALSLSALPTLVYSAGLGLPGVGSDSECAICLAEFAPGEHVRVLPKCCHGFHVGCIDRWLAERSSCPTCRQRLIGTCQAGVGCADAIPDRPTLA